MPNYDFWNKETYKWVVVNVLEESLEEYKKDHPELQCPKEDNIPSDAGEPLNGE